MKVPSWEFESPLRHHKKASGLTEQSVGPFFFVFSVSSLQEEWLDAASWVGAIAQGEQEMCNESVLIGKYLTRTWTKESCCKHRIEVDRYRYSFPTEQVDLP